MRKLKLSICVGMAVVTMSAAGLANARDLTVVDFGGEFKDALHKAYYGPYAKENGLHIIEDTTNGGLAKQKAMVATGNVTWDVVQTEADDVARGCAQGILANPDWSELSNYNKADPNMFTKCGAGVVLWSEVMAFDKSKLKDGPKNWVDFWNVKKWPGKRGLRKSPKLTLELALMADGVPPSNVYDVLRTKKGQDRAFAKLDELKPNILWWESGAQPLQRLASGAVTMTTAYNGRVVHANEEGRNFALVWNHSLYDIDYWAIIAGTPMKKQALDFINYTLSTEPEKVLAQTLPYGVPNKDVIKELSSEVASKLPSAPDNKANALNIDDKFWINYGDELTERFAAWAAR